MKIEISLRSSCRSRDATLRLLDKRQTPCNRVEACDGPVEMDHDGHA